MGLLLPSFAIVLVKNLIIKIITFFWYRMITKLLLVPLMIWANCHKLYSSSSFLATDLRIGRTIVEDFGLHSYRCNVWLPQDYWIGRSFLHKERLSTSISPKVTFTFGHAPNKSSVIDVAVFIRQPC